MNNMLKKVSALLLIILMITSISFNIISYAAEKLEYIEDYNEDNEKLEGIEDVYDNNRKNPYNLMITNRNNKHKAYKTDVVAKNINLGDSSDYNVLLTQDGSGQYYYCMEKGGALMLYANGGATLREFYYNKTAFKDITKAQGMALIYLNSPEVKEINGLKLDKNNTREKLIQYFIWKTGINQGNDVTLPREYSNIINNLLRCVNGKIVIGKDIINTNTGIITINNVDYKIAEFSAYKYTSQLVYRIDNGKGYIESNYKGSGQEIFTFSSKLTRVDTPQIQINKIDKDNNKNLPGAVFTIYNREDETDKFQYETKADGYTELIPVEKNKEYIIKETKAPVGYNRTTNYAIVKVSDKGQVTYKIYSQSGNEIGDVEDWYEKDKDDAIALILTIENEKNDTPRIRLNKIDKEDNENLPGAVFTIYDKETGKEIGQYETKTDGNTELIPVEKNKEYIVKETKAPNGYKMTTDYTIIKVSDKGEVTYKIYNESGIEIGDSKDWYEKDKDDVIALILTVENEKNEQPPEVNSSYPLIMYIKGIAFLDGIEGKESIQDGYYNPENNSDKGLEGIRVDIFDEKTMTPAQFATREKLISANNNVQGDLSEIDWNALDKYGKSTVYTDKDGFFEFYGLNPSHTYYLIFTYNGMRYAEIKATTETGINISNYDISKSNASKAVELNRENKIIKTFSEIGTYPYNYYSLSKNGYNIAYTQDDVEEVIQNGLVKCGNDYEKLYNNLSQYMEPSMAYFIQDCQVSAKISGLGNILSKAEQAVKNYNGSIKQNASNYVYPVVEYKNTPNVDQVEFYKDYGYKIYKYYSDPIIEDGKVIGYTSPYWHNAGNGSVGTLSYDERINGEWSLVSEKYLQQDKQLMQALRNIIAQSNSETRYEENITGHWTELKEGYTSKEINGVQWAMFDTKNQQYLGGWYNKCQSVTYIDEYKKLNENLKKLNEDITENLSCANLGVQYRSTFDMALYNDVLKADVTINNVPGEYVYDKRAANGKSFSFGVNESDLRTYYKNLSDGNIETLRNLKYNTTISGTDEYLNYLRSTDIHYLSDVQKTDNGLAIAGGYDDSNNSIYLTYKIRLINQSAVKGTITEIVDYYNNDFEVVKVYDDNNKEYEFSNTSIYNNRGTKNNSINGYNIVYIKVNNMELENNESQNLYLVLKMKDIQNTLTTEVLNAGYKAVNLAEINGYKTANGYIDIDSMPGNVVETNRFENGKYEDDESKSPTLIFKNPNEEGRTISGIVFEDATTGEWTINQTRQSTANHQYDEKDTLIQGATVQLIQILADGTEKVSCQTATTSEGTYKFIHVRPGNYVVRFAYGNTDMTALTSKNKIDDEGNKLNIINNKSYNGESFENTEKKVNATIGAEGYWYTDSDIETNLRYSDALDNADRRKEVTNNFATLNNKKAEILNSYKDTKVNRNLINELKIQGYMYSTTDVMKLEMEYVGTKNEDTNGTITTAKENGKYKYEYNITNVDFGIVERSKAKLDITKHVSYISIVDSTGKEITGGTYADWQAGNIKYVKWVLGADGFVGMEIDTELLNGATLKITYDITVKDNSEAGNEITSVEVVDYVTNNLNYAKEYANNEGKANSAYGWEAITTDKLIKEGYVNNKSALNVEDETNKIDLSTYQTILKATFKPGEIKRLTLEKNLSSDESSDFNYKNEVEIISSTNTKGRGDYSSIYGNLDPTTFTSRQGDLYWDYIQGKTSSSDNDTETITETSGFNAIRIAEDDSASAERVDISVPTGAKGIIIPGEYYIFGLTLSISLIIGIILIKKYRELE